jgi:hypothetical protein
MRLPLHFGRPNTGEGEHKMKDQRPNSGVLFKNTEKQSDTSPDYRGAICIDGIQYLMSGWIKSGPKERFISLSVKIKTQAEVQVVDDDSPADRPF